MNDIVELAVTLFVAYVVFRYVFTRLIPGALERWLRDSVYARDDAYWQAKKEAEGDNNDGE